MKKIIILGGAGYIGSVLTALLLKKKYNVVCIDSLKFGNSSINHFKKNKKYKFYKLDTREAEKISYISEKSEAVVDLSGIVGDPACSINKKNTYDSNYFNTKKIVDNLKNKKIKKFIYASSCSVYGSSKGKKLITEKNKVKPISLYAELKIKCEKYILKSANDNFSPTILRLATVFGYSQRQRFDLVVNLFTLFEYLNKKIQVFGGDQYRPNVHVYDVARAILKSIIKEKKYTHREIFNVGSNKLNHKIKDIAYIVGKTTNIEIIKTITDKRNYHIDFTKIKNVLKFDTTYTISTGSKNLLNKIKKNKMLRKNLKRYSNFKVESKKYAKQINYKRIIK
jgi:nucleoside-diphosphate-sugar epimerase